MSTTNTLTGPAHAPEAAGPLDGHCRRPDGPPGQIVVADKWEALGLLAGLERYLCGQVVENARSQVALIRNRIGAISRILEHSGGPS